MKTTFLFFILTISIIGRSDKLQSELSQTNNNFFIENKGQWHHEVKYLASIGGMNAWITNSGVTYDYFRIDKNFTDQQTANLNEDEREAFERENANITGHVVKMHFIDANASPIQEGRNKNEAYLNYFIGNDQSKWVSFVPLYESVMQKEIYTNINVKYYFDKNSIRYDYIIKPGAELSKLKLKFEGEESIRINANGELLVNTSIGEVTNGKLYSYQNIDGANVEVVCKFFKDIDGTISIEAGSYDKTRELIIDPLIYSTFLGGNAEDRVRSIVIDDGGYAYIGGNARSPNFPTTIGAYNRTFGGGWNDGFVSKLNTSGGLIFSTFLGGTLFDYCTSVGIDNSGNIYVTGYTSSPNYPATFGAFQTFYKGGSNDIFLTKISPSGSNLIYSTFVGGTGWEQGLGLALNSSGEVYLTGETMSTDFPTTIGAFQIVKNVYLDIFIMKINSAGSGLIYSTYIGGNQDERGRSIQVDLLGNAYVTGVTVSTDYPVTPGAFQLTRGGVDPNIYTEDGFVTKLNPSGSALIYSTYIGGAGFDYGNSLTIDQLGNAFITGITSSTDFPTTPGAYNTTGGDIYTSYAFILKLHPTGSSLVFSTFIGELGGLGSSNSIKIDASGNSYITGSTSDSSFPTTPDAIQTYLVGSSDIFLTKLNSTGSDLYYSTFIGGSLGDVGSSIVIDNSGLIYLTGSTSSPNYPVTLGAFQTTYAGGYSDVIVTKLNITPASLNLILPNDPGLKRSGDTVSIAWNSVGISDLRIQYSSNGGASWNNIMNSYPASAGLYRWILPDISSAQTWIKISDITDPSVYDISHVPFRVWYIVTITQTPIAGHNILNFGLTNLKLDLNVLNPAPITAKYYEYEAPYPVTLPYGITGITPYYWKITAPGTIIFNTAWLLVPVSTLREIEGKDIVWLKRESPENPWTNIWGTVVNGVLANATTFSTFSEFTIGFWKNPIPIELTKFTAEVVDDYVKLNWSTATELNNRGFEIQRKSSKSDFITIAFVKGSGNTSVPMDYAWSEKLESGVYYYRLKQIDFDNRFELSREVEAIVIPKSFTLAQNYPNPFNPSTTIRYTIPFESRISIRLYNTLGENILEYNLGIKEPGFYELNMNSNGLASGVYFYMINAESTDGQNNYNAVRKMTVLK